jgi:hypothetical protein
MAFVVGVHRRPSVPGFAREIGREIDRRAAIRKAFRVVQGPAHCSCRRSGPEIELPIVALAQDDLLQPLPVGLGVGLLALVHHDVEAGRQVLDRVGAERVRSRVAVADAGRAAHDLDARGDDLRSGPGAAVRAIHRALQARSRSEREIGDSLAHAWTRRGTVRPGGGETGRRRAQHVFAGGEVGEHECSARVRAHAGERQRLR